MRSSPRSGAIFTAKPGVLTGPIKFRVDYFMFEVTRIEPARQRTLAEGQATIRTQLADRQRRRNLATFIAAWRRKWTAEMSCARATSSRNAESTVAREHGRPDVVQMTTPLSVDCAAGKGFGAPPNSHGVRIPITSPENRLPGPYTTQVVSTAP
jgi:hypothetical protein